MEKSPIMDQLTAFTPLGAAASERMLASLSARIAGPQVSHALRSLQFADRLLSGFFRVMGMEGAAEPALMRERPASPMNWIFPSPWFAEERPEQKAQRPRPAQQPAAAPQGVVPKAAEARPLPANAPQPEVREQSVPALPSTGPTVAERGAIIGLPQVAAPLAPAEGTTQPTQRVAAPAARPAASAAPPPAAASAAAPPAAASAAPPAAASAAAPPAAASAAAPPAAASAAAAPPAAPSVSQEPPVTLMPAPGSMVTTDGAVTVAPTSGAAPRPAEAPVGEASTPTSEGRYVAPQAIEAPPQAAAITAVPADLAAASPLAATAVTATQAAVEAPPIDGSAAATTATTSAADPAPAAPSSPAAITDPAQAAMIPASAQAAQGDPQAAAASPALVAGQAPGTTELRVIDLLAQLRSGGKAAEPPQADQVQGPSALGRAFAHLRWADRQLHVHPEGKAPSAVGLSVEDEGPPTTLDRAPLPMPVLDPAEAPRAAESGAAMQRPLVGSPAGRLATSERKAEQRPESVAAPALTLAVPLPAPGPLSTTAAPTSERAVASVMAAPVSARPSAAETAAPTSGRPVAAATAPAEAAAGADAVAQDHASAPASVDSSGSPARPGTQTTDQPAVGGPSPTVMIPTSLAPLAATSGAAAAQGRPTEAPIALAPAPRAAPPLGLSPSQLPLSTALSFFSPEARTDRRTGADERADAGAPSESAAIVPMLSSLGRLAERFVQTLSGWRAEKDAQALPVPTHRPFAQSMDYLDWLRPAEGGTAPRSGAIGAKRTDGAARSAPPHDRDQIVPELGPAASVTSAPPLTLLAPELLGQRPPAAPGAAPGRAPAAALTPPPAQRAAQQPGAQLLGAPAALSTPDPTGQGAAPAAPAAGSPPLQPSLDATASAAPMMMGGAAGDAAPVVSSRPGSIGSFAEQFSTTIGVRAAGLSTDFVDPQALQALSASLGGPAGILGLGPLSAAQAAMLAGGLGHGERVLAPLLAQLLGASFSPSSPLVLSLQAGLAATTEGAAPSAGRFAFGPYPLIQAAPGPFGAGPGSLGSAPGRPGALPPAATPYVTGAVFSQPALTAAKDPARATLGAPFAGPATAPATALHAAAPAAALPLLAQGFGPAAFAHASATALPFSAVSLFPAAARALLFASKLGLPPDSATTDSDTARAPSPEAPAGPGDWPLLHPHVAEGPRAAGRPGAAPFSPLSIAPPFSPLSVPSPAPPPSALAAPVTSAFAPQRDGAPAMAAGATAGATDFSEGSARWSEASARPRPLLVSLDRPAVRPAAMGDLPPVSAAARPPAGLGAQAMTQKPLWSSLSQAGPAPSSAGTDGGAAMPPGLLTLWYSLFAGAAPAQDAPSPIQTQGGAGGGYPLLLAPLARAAAQSALRPQRAETALAQRPSMAGPEPFSPPFAAQGLAFARALSGAAQGSTWEPPATVRAALSATADSDKGLPMWEGMDPIDLDVVEEAFGEEGPRDPRAQGARGAGRHSPLTLIEGGRRDEGQGSPSTYAGRGPDRAAPAWRRSSEEATLVTAPLMGASRPAPSSDPSSKLIEAVRAHAQAQATASDDRITLGDLTLIAIAAGQDQVAAAGSGNAPASVQNDEAASGQPMKGESKEDRTRMVAQVRGLVGQILDEIAFKERMDDERYGEQ